MLVSFLLLYAFRNEDGVHGGAGAKKVKNGIMINPAPKYLFAIAFNASNQSARYEQHLRGPYEATLR